MANIRNSISLTDRMTPTLRSILKAMDSTLKVMKDLDKASNKGVQSKAYKRAEKDIKRANNALIKMRNHTDRVTRSARDAQKALSGMGGAAGAVASGLGAMGRASSQFVQSLASGLYIAQKLANAVGGVMSSADTSRSQVARLGLYNTSGYSNEELYGQVFRTAMDTRSGLENTADLVNKLLVSGVYSGTGAPQAAISTADIINKALVAGGGTQEQNDRSLLQLTQGLASGVLQGDELRSIREQTPYFAQMLAEGLAKVDDKFEGIGIGDLKELGALGELTSDRVIKAMWKMQDEIDSDFKAMPKTFGQATSSMQNVWQYFLWMLSDAEGPLGKINDELWKFVDYLQSPQGLELLEDVAIGINVIATALAGAMSAAGTFITYLQNNAPVAQALFIGLGAIAVTSGLAAAAAWLSAVWPILLVGAVVGIVAYQFLEAGYTAQEVVGAIAGGFAFLGYAIWDTVIWIVQIVYWAISVVWDGLVGLSVTIINIVLLAVLIVVAILQGAVQAVLWVITTIWAVFVIIYNVIQGIFQGAWAIIKLFIINTYEDFVDFGQGILSVLSIIAKGIDWVFGSNLADTVDGWSAGLGKSLEDFKKFMDVEGDFEDIEGRWDTSMQMLGDMYAGEGKYDDLNITDNMDNVATTLLGLMGEFGETGTGMMLDPTMLDGWRGDNLLDPMSGWDSGNAWGASLVDEIGGLNLGIPDNSVLDAFNADGVVINGGKIDSVGSIDSDVAISDEDLKLLRDMAARDYLLQLQTITPVANVKFGDVRETADVGKIVEVIEQMVEEQMATSLVD